MSRVQSLLSGLMGYYNMIEEYKIISTLAFIVGGLFGCVVGYLACLKDFEKNNNKPAI